MYNPCNWFQFCHRLHQDADALGALLTGKHVELYEQYLSNIKEDASEFGLDPVLLATVIQLEGAGLETYTEAIHLGIPGWGVLAGWAFDFAHPRDYGIGNTRPSNVQDVYETFFPCDPVPSQLTIRLTLSTDNSYGIWAAAGYLALLRYDFSKQGYGYLTDRDDAISYEVSHNWHGVSATPRGRAYDLLSRVIAASPGYD